MGYCHYWTQHRDFTKEEWSSLTKDVKALFDCLPHKKVKAPGHGFLGGMKVVRPEICGPFSKKNPPVVNDEEIVFADKKDHWRTQVFRLNRTTEVLGPQGILDGKDGEYGCKTNLEAYDIVVCAVLILAKFRGGDAIDLRSDGKFSEEWQRAFDLLERRVAEQWDRSERSRYIKTKWRLEDQDKNKNEEREER